MRKPFDPNLHTAPADFSKEEQNKRRGAWLMGSLAEELRDEQPDLAWEAEQIAKSHGIYMQFNRATTGTEKSWMYMIRISNPGGGPITSAAWRVLDELSEAYTKDADGRASLRLTTRQNIQLHWVKKPAVIEIVRALAKVGILTLNGCGDNTRNVMACPLSRWPTVVDTHRWAQRAGAHFQLPIEPFIKIFAIDPSEVRQPESSYHYGPGLLNRKLKIAFSTVHRDPCTGRIRPDNCVELLTNDLAVAPVVRGDRVEAYQIYAGGGQGERNNKPSTATLAVPLGIVDEDRLLSTLDAVVSVHDEWGDRQNRHWARLKYVVKKQGIEWLRQQVEERLGSALEPPEPELDYGDRQLHHGWHATSGTHAFGAFIENGRLADTAENGHQKAMVRQVLERWPMLQVMVTPNQDLLFTEVPEEAKGELSAELSAHGYGLRHGKPFSELRRHSGACVGRDTCRLAYTDSEKLEPELLDELEARGFGALAESIGITGCERQCFRPATKTIGLVGSGFDVYQLKLFGDESGRFQGRPLVSSDGAKTYLRQVPRGQLADLLAAIFRWYLAERQDRPGLGEFLRSQGADAIIARLSADPATAELMVKIYRVDEGI